jgi:hypothetical protein
MLGDLVVSRRFGRHGIKTKFHGGRQPARPRSGEICRRPFSTAILQERATRPLPISSISLSRAVSQELFQANFSKGLGRGDGGWMPLRRTERNPQRQGSSQKDFYSSQAEKSSSTDYWGQIASLVIACPRPVFRFNYNFHFFGEGAYKCVITGNTLRSHYQRILDY